jgi:hypothetical protein
MLRVPTLLMTTLSWAILKADDLTSLMQLHATPQHRAAPEHHRNHAVSDEQELADERGERQLAINVDARQLADERDELQLAVNADERQLADERDEWQLAINADKRELADQSHGAVYSIFARTMREKALSTAAHRSTGCIKFLHIPKTGGSSIDSANMHEDKPVFDSFEYQSSKRIADSMPAEEFEEKYDSNLGVMFDKAYENLEYYMNKWLPKYHDFYQYIVQPDGNTCEDVHAPPRSNASVAKFYSKDHCDVTFCAVREPLQRFVSAYEMTQQGSCEPADFEARAHDLLKQIKAEPYKDLCMFVPQVQMVYGASSRESATKQYCSSILHTEGLEGEFNAFMKENNQTLRLGDDHKMGHSAYGGCKVDRDAMTQASKDMIYDFYLADYKAFGYVRP